MAFSVERDPEGIQTPNLLIRSQMLYSVELRGQLDVQGTMYDLRMKGVDL